MSEENYFRAEASRLEAAIHTIHDYLHQGEINKAHEACECAMKGEDVQPEHITMDAASRIRRFAHAFNELGKSIGLVACWIAFVPDANGTGVSMQGGGHVDAIKTVEGMMGKSSTYMGEHTNRTPGGIILPGGGAK